MFYSIHIVFGYFGVPLVLINTTSELHTPSSTTYMQWSEFVKPDQRQRAMVALDLMRFASQGELAPATDVEVARACLYENRRSIEKLDVGAQSIGASSDLITFRVVLCL